MRGLNEWTLRLFGSTLLLQISRLHAQFEAASRSAPRISVTG